MSSAMCGTDTDPTMWEKTAEENIATVVGELRQQVGSRVLYSPEVPPAVSLQVLRERYAEAGKQLLLRYPFAMVEKALATIYHRLEAAVFGEPPPRPRDVTIAANY